MHRAIVAAMVLAPADATGPRAPVARGSFVAGSAGEWRITEMRTICGDGLPAVAALTRADGSAFATAPEPGSGWVLHGVRSNERYLERDEKARLATLQEGLGRSTSLVAALIPIRKSDLWWDLPQDERRAIFEARSRHIAIGSRRAVRLSHLVRVRGGRRRCLRGAGRAPARDRRMALRHARGSDLAPSAVSPPTGS